MTESDNRPAWLPELRGGAGPRYLQIADLLERAVASGALRAGDRLPPQRRLAELLGLDLTTVTRGLNEARRRQLIEARGPLGTFVSAPKIELTPRMDLSMNIPPPPADANLEALLKEGVARVLARGNVDLLMTYQMGGGSRADHTAGLAWLKPMLGRPDPARLVVCPGAQSALAAVLLSCTQPGDTIVAEPLVYPGLPLVAAQLGRRIETVDADADGMRPDALEAACRAHGARLVYLNPTLQNPTARTMPAQRRRDIAAVAARRGARIVEDDPYWLFEDDPPPPLASIAPERVYYMSTLSKCLSPGLRTAFVQLPEAEGRDGFLAALRAMLMMPAPLMTALVTQWIHDGTAAQLYQGILNETRARQRVAAQVLHHGQDVPPGRGIHLWHALPDDWTARDLAAAALTEGLVVAPSGAFHAGPTPPNAIRLSLGGGATRAELERALAKLAGMLAKKKPLEHRNIVV